MKRLFFQLFILIFCILTTYQSPSFSFDHIIIEDGADHYLATQYSKLYIDKSASLKFFDILNLSDKQFDFIGRDVLNDGNTRSAYWIKLKITNASTHDKHWLVKVDGPTIDYVDFYQYLDDLNRYEEKMVSNALPFKFREIYHRASVFKLKIEANESREFYLRVRTDTLMAFRLIVLSQEKFYQLDRLAQLFFGLYYGLFIVMLIYNAFLLFMYRDKNYFLFILFIAAWIPLQMCFNGIGYEYLWPGFPWLERIAGGFFGALVGFIMLIFSRNFLRTKMYMTKFDKLLKGLTWFLFFVIIASFFIDPIYITNITRGTSVVVILSLIYTAFSSYRQGYKPARIYLLGWSVHFLVSVIYLLMIVNVIPINIFVEYAIHVSSALLVIFLSIALVDRMNMIRAELLSKEKLRSINKELALARSLQLSIIPQVMPEIKGLSVFAKYISMKEVGGDFYDLNVSADNSLSAIIADVSGHGISAALIASMVKIAYSVEASASNDPEKILMGMNRILYKKFEKMLITASVVHVDPAHKYLTMACAGHLPTLIYRNNYKCLEVLETENGFPIGLFQHNVFHRIETKIDIGDRIFLYTDCIVESKNEAGEPFGEARFADFVTQYHDLSAENLSDLLLIRISQWIGKDSPFDDDYTFLIIDIE